MSKFHAIYSKGGVSPEPGGNTYGETQVLLWTNSNPSSNFAAQKVSIDLSNYDGVIIEFRSKRDNKLLNITKLGKNELVENFGSGNTNNESRTRNINAIDDTGITFSDGYLNGIANSGHVIPNKIWGYREYMKETLTSSTTNQKTLPANKDVIIGKGNYALVVRGDDSTIPFVVSKGAIIGYAYDQATTGFYGQAMLIKPDETGVISVPGSSNYQIITVG